MKKLTVMLIAVCMIITAVSFSASAETEPVAEGDGATDVSIPDNTIITYGYLQQFKEELREEIIAELTASGGIEIAQTYEEVSLTAGQTLLLAPDAEVIFRGGSAVAIASSTSGGEGIVDISVGGELFSGERLSFGHIYHAGESESKKAIAVTGDRAYFTVKGGYEIG